MPFVKGVNHRFLDKVPKEIRETSVFCLDYGCNVAPDGRCWSYGEPVQGVETRDRTGQPILVARWVTDLHGEIARDDCGNRAQHLTTEELDRYLAR